MATASLLRDAFMSIMITRLMESNGIGPASTGNALAVLGKDRPFLIWSLLGLLGGALF